MATGLPYWNVVVDKFGNAIPNAQVAVLAGFGANTSTQPGSPLASIFSDVNLTQPINNPINTDALGRFQFFAQTGNYLIQIYSSLSPPLIAQYVISVTLSGPSVLSVAGTANQITVTNGFVNAVVSLPSVIIAPGTLELVGGSLKLDGATSGSSTIQVKAAAGTPNPLQLPLTTGTSGQVLTTDGNNPQQLSWATPATGTAGIAKYAYASLGADITNVAHDTPTVALTLAVTMPSSGGPFRALVSYGLAVNCAGSGIYGAWISDGTVTSGEDDQEYVNTGNTQGVSAAPIMPPSASSTYANSANITFTLNFEWTTGPNNPTIKALAQFGSHVGTWISVSIMAAGN